VVTAADAPALVRMVLHDAGTYDIATKTGGWRVHQLQHPCAALLAWTSQPWLMPPALPALQAASTAPSSWSEHAGAPAEPSCARRCPAAAPAAFLPCCPCTPSPPHPTPRPCPCPRAPARSAELSRPENAQFRPLVARLAGAKAKIDEQSVATGAGPVSWADLLYMAGKTAVELSWRDVKVGASAAAGARGLELWLRHRVGSCGWELWQWQQISSSCSSAAGCSSLRRMTQASSSAAGTAQPLRRRHVLDQGCPPRRCRS
jgi:hypothetical protein